MSQPLLLADGDPTREVTFFVPGEAKSERKRQRPFIDKQGRPRMGSRTDEPDRKDWKAAVRFAAWAAFAEGPWQGPLELTLTFMAVRPASWPKKPSKGNAWPDYPWKRPDWEHCVTPVQDAMNGVAWLDDAQIVTAIVRKTWAEKPGVLVTVRRLTE